MDELLTAQDVSKELHLHINTVKRYLTDGTLKGHRIGKKGLWRIYKKDLTDFIENSVPCGKDLTE